MSRDTKIKDTKRIITGYDEKESQIFLMLVVRKVVFHYQENL